MAVVKYMAIARKLQSACNKKFGVKLLINTRQWYSKDKNSPVSYYTIMQVVDNNKTGKESTVELFKTYSQIQLVLWLRDYWYKLNGWEVPQDNEVWEEVKNKIERTEQIVNNSRTKISS